MKLDRKIKYSKRTFLSKIFIYGNIVFFSSFNPSKGNEPNNQKNQVDLIIIWKSKRKMSLFSKKNISKLIT